MTGCTPPTSSQAPAPTAPSTGSSTPQLLIRTALWVIPALLVIITLTLDMFSLFEENTLVALVFTFVHDVPFVALWLGAAWGYGTWISRWTWRSKLPALVQWSIGAAVLMWLDQALGATGLLQSFGAAGAWALIIIGLLGTVWSFFVDAGARGGIGVSPVQGFRGDTNDSPLQASGTAFIWIVPISLTIGLLIIASASAPGWLWSSEAHGFDVLEYHLQLPKEWLNAGRLVPVDHLVYSYLPNYMEGAFYHLALLAIPFTPDTSHPAFEIATAAQLLHACIALLAGGVLMHAFARLLSSRQTETPQINFVSALPGVIIITLPWTVVTGSMAYDEMAVVLFFVTALYLLFDAADHCNGGIGVSPVQSGKAPDPLAPSSPLPHWLTIGFIIGLAVGAKITALGSVVLSLGILCLWILWKNRSPRLCTTMLIGGASGFILALLPYLVRNWFALRSAAPGSRNILFPLFTESLGRAHWTTEQSQRWAGAHHVDLALTDQLGRLWNMAFMHPQWVGLWFVGIAALVVTLIIGTSRSRRIAIGCAITLIIQLVFWLRFTHLQSRFLWTSMVPLAIITPLAWVHLHDKLKFRRATRVLTALIMAWTLGQFATALVIYTLQRDGRPSTYVGGVERRSTSRWNDLGDAVQESLMTLSADVYLTVFVDPDANVYLLGDSTPFYNLHRLTWHTTWDTSPLGEVIRTLPDDPTLWGQALREKGIDYILVNQFELYRLIEKDRWYDPDVTMERIATLLKESVTLIHTWPSGSDQPVQALYRLK